MSLRLDLGTSPKNLLAKTYGMRMFGKRIISIGSYDITYEDFCCLIEYWLTNENLERNDIRRAFLKHLRKYETTKGYPRMRKNRMVRTTRLHIPVKKGQCFTWFALQRKGWR